MFVVVGSLFIGGWLLVGLRLAVGRLLVVAVGLGCWPRLRFSIQRVFIPMLVCNCVLLLS